jgi:acyl-CoA synthetase (AMP-forming)/AMP-acid ligase II
MQSVLPLSDRINHARTLTIPGSLPDYLDFLPLVLARSESDSEFLTYLDVNHNKVSFSYWVFCEMVCRTARFLQSNGLKRGDRIATISPNHWQTVVHYFACWILGLVVVPVNLGEDDDRIEYILDKASVKLAFVRDGYTERIERIIGRDDLSRIQIVRCTDDPEDFMSPMDGNFTAREYLSDMINLSSDKPQDLDGSNGIFDDSDPQVDRSELDALIVFTSGTTGNPKGVVLSQRNLLEDAHAISEWHQIDAETRMMCVLPIHHVNGTVVTLCTPFYRGGSVVLNEKFRVGHFFSTIHKEKVHIVSVVPTLLSFLTSHHQTHPVGEFPILKHIICGAGPLTVSVAQHFEDKFGIRIIHGYGLSETTCYSCYLPISLSDEEHKTWMRAHGYPSIGVALPVNEMAIHGDQGNPLKDGERGEIVIRGRNVMKGYYANDVANEAAFTHGWFRSGDEGFALSGEDGQRYYFITGRLKELIIRGGVNLAPLEIDEVINRAPGVKAGISVGFENDWYGEEVGAYVQMVEGVEGNEEEIIAFCREHLPFSKCPKVVVIGNDIPVTSTGKYQRMKVANLFKQWKAIQFKV